MVVLRYLISKFSEYFDGDSKECETTGSLVKDKDFLDAYSGACGLKVELSNAPRHVYKVFHNLNRS